MPADKEIKEYLALMAEWQRLLSEALSDTPAFVMWTPWFNIFKGSGELMQDADPITSMVNCRIGRGVSIHLYPSWEIQGRWARLHQMAEGTDDEIDHLQIAVPIESPCKDEVRQLVIDWLGLTDPDDPSRLTLIENFCVSTCSRR